MTVTAKAIHTPGPWKVSALDGRTCGPSRLLVCNGTDIPQLQAVAIVTLRTGETDANARLIAAAPTMLQALREVAGDHILIETPGAIPVCCFCSADEGCEHEPECTMNVVFAAINRAEGRQPREVYIVDAGQQAVQS